MRATIRGLRTSWWHLTVAMVALAVMAVGAHTMSIAAPALAEQEQLAQEAEAAAERAVVRNPAATDGLPVPALLGGVVLAFAVGLSAGHVHRRRRATRRSAVAAARPDPAPTPPVPARPAPPPPEPARSARAGRAHGPGAAGRAAASPTAAGEGARPADPALPRRACAAASAA